MTLRVYWVFNFAVVCLFAASAIIRLSSVHWNYNSELTKDDVFFIINIPVSAFLLLVAIRGSTGITTTRETHSVLEDDAKLKGPLSYEPMGIFSLADACRSGVVDAITELKRLRIKTVMLTEDSHAAATYAKEQVSMLGHAIEVVHAELLPEDKARIIRNLKKERPTAMIGDGVNNALALATADIGISMGISGSALATESGNVTLMSNDIRKIPQPIRLARKSRRKIIENVTLSINTKLAVIALACSGHPLLWATVLVDVGTCLVVILNSMLLLRGTGGTKSNCASHAHKHKSGGGCGHHHKRVAFKSNCTLPDPCNHSAPVHKQCCSHGVPNCENSGNVLCRPKNPPRSHSSPVHEQCHSHEVTNCENSGNVSTKSTPCSHSSPVHEQCCSHGFTNCENSGSVSCRPKNSPCIYSAGCSKLTQRNDHNHAPESNFAVGEVENGGSGNSSFMHNGNGLMSCKGQCGDLGTICDVEAQHVSR